MSVKTDRAVVVLCAFVVGLCLGVVAETIEVFKELPDFADRPAIRALVRRDIDERLVRKKATGEDVAKRILIVSGTHWF